MRYEAALTPPGAPRPRTFRLRKPVIVLAFLAAAVWAAGGYAQEAFLGHRLAQQAADIRNQNALISAQNAGYRKDAQAISNGSADEEDARINGYSKPQERVYIVTAPPTPSPSPSPTP